MFSADAFVLGRIDEILSWEKSKEQEKDVRFVELGEYLCEVRAKQYWRLENLKSFDEFLEKRFAESRRKAYYLMAIHANGRDVASQSTKGRAVLTSFGFTKRPRTNSGYVFQLTQEHSVRLHQLVACYGIDGYQDSFLHISPDGCHLCREAGFKEKSTRFRPGTGSNE